MSGGHLNKKIRVAFFPPTDSSWMGGVNYYKNLFYALHHHVNSEIEIFVFLNTSANNVVIQSYLPFADKVFYVDFLEKNKLSGFITKVENRIFGTHKFLEFLLKKYQIDVVSHSNFYGFKTIKSIGWIPDFQHLHLPNMFSKDEVEKRDRGFMRLIKRSDAVFLSSYDALNDFKSFSSKYINKAKVLQFVSQPLECYFNLSDNNRVELLHNYGLPEDFFFLPNQFWKHKNHITVFKAVRLLKQQGKDFFIVCTGDFNDYRDPGYIQYLKNFIAENRLEENIFLLGMVPYKDVNALIKFSKAVINPSLFEGWSSTVEECKSVGKSLIISDIKVHKEQSPDAIFFDKYSPESLSNVLAQFNEYDKNVIDQEEIKFRTKKYANVYLEVIRSVLNK